MLRRCLLVLLPGLVWAGSLKADDPPLAAKKKETRYQAGAFAHRLWTITDLILEHHVDPPTRQEMLLAGLKVLRFTDPERQFTDLSRRMSAVTTEEQFAKLLQEIWPSTRDDQPSRDEALENGVFQGLRHVVPGEPALIPQRQYVALEQAAGNRYVGTGIQIRLNQEEGYTQIVIPFPRGPARRAGAKANDLIVEVDGVSMKGVSLPKVVERLSGKEGTKVIMVVRQPGETETRTLNLTRAPIPFDTAVGFRRLSEEDYDFRVDASEPIAYVRLTSINSSALHELRKVEGKLRSSGARAMVLDLRSLMGDKVHHAALVADGFLDSGVMWRVRDRDNRVKEFRADRECLFRDWPMVVLVGQHTHGTPALAVAAALQDNHRAVVVGEKASSDGLLRDYVPLPNEGGALYLATGTLERAVPPKAPKETGPMPWRLPSSSWVVEPDHEVALSAKQREAVFQWVREQEHPDPPPGAMTKPPEDPQLAKALELLRAALKKRDEEKK
jgi:carboxyl-terminal processing protease